MIFASELLLVSISIFTISNVIKKKIYSLFTLIFLMFNVLYVTPILFYWILGIPDYGNHHGYNLAINDERTSIIYNILITIGVVIFYRYLKKKASNNKINNNKKREFTLEGFKFKYNNFLVIVLLIIIFLPFLAIILSPNPENYLLTLGYFNSQVTSPNTIEIAYHQQLHWIVLSAFLSFILLRLLSNNKLLNIYIYMNIFFWLLLENKRTLFAFLIFAFAFIDSFKKKENNKKIIKKFIIAGIMVLAYFLIYSFISGKESQTMTNVDLLRQYFFRDVDLKLGIYWRLNPNHFHLLDYNGQSLVYDMLFYIPRSYWPTKPWPYDVYATSAAMGHNSFYFYDWNIQVSWIGELVSNLGIVGFLIGISSYIWLNNIVTKINNPLLSFFSFYYLIRMSMLGFSSNQMETTILLLIIFSFLLKNERKKIKNRNKVRTWVKIN